MFPYKVSRSFRNTQKDSMPYYENMEIFYVDTEW